MDLQTIIKKINKDPLDTIDTLNIKELEDIITIASDKYYNTDKSIIKDEVYDLLIDYLRNRNPKSTVLKNIGAPSKKNKVPLDYWLGSMDKIKPSSGNLLDKWKTEYKKPYYLTDKLDGVSALLVYRKNGDIKLFTRGTATEGQDITTLIKYFNLPSFEEITKYIIKHKINADKEDNLIAFRGEIIINTKIFESKWSKILKNARNAVSGLVNSKTTNSDLAKDTNLVLYEVVDPFLTIEKQLKILNELGFLVVHYKKMDDINFEILSNYLRERRTKSNYTIDGIIVTNNGLFSRNEDGNPKYAFAFKDVLEDQVAVSTITEIEWKASKNGYLNPTVIIKSVSIGGVEIKRVTAHNAKYVVDNKIGIGAEIEIIRSGDVIPYIQKVIKPATDLKLSLPKGKWHWNETEVDIILDDTNSLDVQIRNLQFFFSSLDTKGMGDKNVEKIYNAGFNTVEKILNMKESDFLKIDGFKEKTASNLVSSIKESLKNISLSQLMASSNTLGEGMGNTRLSQVLDAYPNLMTDYKKWSKQEFKDKIKELNGWEDKTSTTLVNNFPAFIDFYEKIKKFVTLEQKKEIKKTKLTGQIMVLSGFRDSNLEEKLELMGVKVSSSVSKNTNYLVVKDQATIDEGTGKVQKAQEIGVKIITKDKLNNLMK